MVGSVINPLNALWCKLFPVTSQKRCFCHGEMRPVEALIRHDRVWFCTQDDVDEYMIHSRMGF